MERGGYRPESSVKQVPQSETTLNHREDDEELRAAQESANREVTAEVPRVEVQESRRDGEPLAFEKLPEEVQMELLPKMLDGMREAIGSVRDYAVFASTAMYLNGEDIVRRGHEEGRELMKPPGDFDAALYKNEDIDEIRNRMRRMPDVIFSNAKKDRDGNIMRDESGEVIYDGKPGEYGTIPGQDLKILAGKRLFDVQIDGKPAKVAYDFEFFLRSKMVPQEVVRSSSTESHGLRILNLEGLQDQYARNLEYETKVDQAVKQLVEYLHTDDPEVKKFKSEIVAVQEEDNVALTDRTLEILKHLDVGPEEMKRALEIQNELDRIEAETHIPYAKLTKEGVVELYAKAYREAGANDKADEIEKNYKHVQELISKRATYLAGSKTKIWKRDLNLIQLARLRGQ